MNHIPPWIVRINFGAPAVGSLVTFCPYPNGYLSLPAGRDTPVKGGNGAASARSHSYYLECLIPLVEDFKDMLYDFPFHDLLKIGPLFQNHPWPPPGLLGSGRIAIKGE